MSVASQVFVGTVAGAVMVVRVAVAIHRARVDGRIAERHARDEQEWRAVSDSRTRHS
jgi:hypothetical protein